MALTIAEIRRNTLKARELMLRSRQQSFAVGAFNVDNQETLLAIARAAQALDAPVMVEASHGEVMAIGHDNLRDMVDNYKEEFDIEMYINLDHAPTVDAAKRGIDAGFEFIHIDIIQARHDAKYDEIVAATKEIVHYATFTGAIVESEPEYFRGSSNLHDEEINYDELRQTFTTPDEAAKFAAETGLDTFAVAIGNLHGKFKVPAQLDIELLKQIRAATHCNLSLHGGSGIPEHYFKEAAREGISKVNVNTDLRVAFRTTLEKQLQDNPNQYAVMKLMPEVYDAVQKVVEEKIEAFGSAGKAET